MVVEVLVMNWSKEAIEEATKIIFDWKSKWHLENNPYNESLKEIERRLVKEALEKAAEIESYKEEE